MKIGTATHVTITFESREASLLRMLLAGISGPQIETMLANAYALEVDDSRVRDAKILADELYRALVDSGHAASLTKVECCTYP